jgi:hypothetical protein
MKNKSNTTSYTISPMVKTRIMRRVYGIWLMRLLAPVLFFEIPALALLVKLGAQQIFVQRVFENIAASVSGGGELLRFMYRAVLHTSGQTQLLLGISVVIGVLFLKDFSRTAQTISSLLFKGTPLPAYSPIAYKD